MTPPYAVSFRTYAARQIQRERSWLHNHRGPHVADAFEAELRHTLELVAENPTMGPAVPGAEDERRIFLLGSRFHVYYLVDAKKQSVRVIRLRHEKQRPVR